MASSKNFFVAAAALCGLTAALPQGIDYAAIAAAPPVATGPAAIDPDLNLAAQTASLYTSFTVNTVATAPSTPAAANQPRGLTPFKYTGQQTSSASGAGVGAPGVAASVQAGAAVWLNGKGGHNILGGLNNFGSVFLSQSAFLKAGASAQASGLTCGWSGINANLYNYFGAIIQLNDIEASASASFDWDLNTFWNNGTIQWCARGDFGGSIFGLTSETDLYNYGYISFEQSGGNQGASISWNTDVSASASWFPWFTSTKTPNIYHNGAFRLINTVFHNVQNIYGSGCWQIGFNATLYLEGGTGTTCNPSYAPAMAGQSITFTDASAVLHLEAGVYTYNSLFGAQIFGFGVGNAIEFYQTPSSYSYDPSSGSLTIRFLSASFFGQSKVVLNIGKGYIVAKFRLSKHQSSYGVYWAIYYDASCPSQPKPSQCTQSVPTCTPYGNTPPPPYSSSPASSTTTAPVTTSPTSVPVTTSSSSSSTSPATTSSTNLITSTCVPTTPTVTSTSYSPYYPALTTGYTTNPALTGTTTAGQACPTQPEAGTYCGFINPNDPCAPQPDGYGPVPTPDTDSAFLAYPTLHSMAQAAPTQVASTRCGSYQEVFVDLNASTSADSYLGLYVLQSYDVQRCANLCDANQLCTSFNIYIERDPTVNPSTASNQDPTVWGNVCPNPGSMTTFKCTLWGSSIDASTATNYGGYREQFHVVVTGSNGYDRTNNSTPLDPTSPVSSSSVISTTVPISSATSSSISSTTVATTSATTTPSGPKPSKPCKPPKPCRGGKAIDAPGFWMGSRFFPGPYNPQVCSDFALAQNTLNQQAGSGSQCKMFNAYYLHRNGVPHGTYCSLYNTVLNDTFATWSGGVSGGVSFSSRQSWLYELNL